MPLNSARKRFCLTHHPPLHILGRLATVEVVLDVLGQSLNLLLACLGCRLEVLNKLKYLYIENLYRIDVQTAKIPIIGCPTTIWSSGTCMFDSSRSCGVRFLTRAVSTWRHRDRERPGNKRGIGGSIFSNRPLPGYLDLSVGLSSNHHCWMRGERRIRVMKTT